MELPQAVQSRLHAASNLALRLGLGLVFTAHGCQKVFGAFGGGGFRGAIEVASNAGFQPAALWGPVLALTELAGGLAALLGFYARAAAAFLAFVMAVAITAVHAGNGFFNSNGGIEYPLTLFLVALSVVLEGSGPYSLDTWLRLKHEEHVAKKALAHAAAKEAGEHGEVEEHH